MRQFARRFIAAGLHFVYSLSGKMSYNPRQITFRNQFVQPPSNLYIENGTAIRVSVFSSVACTLVFNWRVLRPDQDITPGNDFLVIDAGHAASRLVTVKTIPEMEGFILSFRAGVSSGTVERGQCWVTVEYMKAISSVSVAWETFVNGYVTTAIPLSFPQTPLSEPGQGNGYRIAQNADALNVYTCPANTVSRIEGAFFQAVCNGVSTIRAKLTASTGPEFPAEANQPINTNYTYNFFARSYPHVIPAGTPINVYEEMLPLIMRPGDTLTAGAVVLTGAPVLGQLSLYGTEWIVP